MASPLEPDDRRLTQLRRLTDVSRALTQAMSFSEVLHIAVARAAELLGTERAVLMLQNPDGLLSVQASVGIDELSTRDLREPADETLITRLRGLLCVDDEHFVGVPLVVNGAVTGILGLSLAAPPDEEEEWLLSALADQAAVALEKSRLDEAARFRERVIAIVSHDLRNPLGAVLIGANLLAKRPELSDETRKLVELVKRGVKRSIKLVGDLLDYTQAHLGSGVHLERRPAELAAILTDVMNEMQASHPHRAFALSTEGDLSGEWDPDRLAQIIGNLIANALTYSPADSVVDIEARADGEWVALTVHNAGRPIAPERLPYIFEPMQRATSHGEETHNVGLGLYIVKHLVSAHGGTVSVDTHEDEGTTFTVRLPR